EPARKLLWEAIIVVAAVWLWPAPSLLPWPLLNRAFLVCWLLATVNAFNLIDGLDGLAGGIGILAALAAAAIAAIFNGGDLTYRGFAIAGALAGFLWFNLPPATVFMGDTGALPMGLMLGALAIEAGTFVRSGALLTRLMIPGLILFVPLMDMAVVSVCRYLSERPMARRGRDHSHHKLVSLGLDDRTAMLICWSLGALAGGLAVAIAAMSRAYVLMMTPLVVALLGPITFFVIDLTFDALEPGLEYERAHGPRRWLLGFGYKRRLAEVVLDCALITAAYFGAFLLRFDFVMTDQRLAELLPNLRWVLPVTYGVLLVGGLYRGMWRYAGLTDLARFTGLAVCAGSVLLLFSTAIAPIMVSGSIAVLFTLLLFNLIAASRLSFRAFRAGIAAIARETRRVLIIGTGADAETALRYLAAQSRRGTQAAGFVTNDLLMVGKTIHGLKVLGTIGHLDEIQRMVGFSELMLATDATPAEIELIHGWASAHGIPVTHLAVIVKEIATGGNNLALDRPEEKVFAESITSKNLLV